MKKIACSLLLTIIIVGISGLTVDAGDKHFYTPEDLAALVKNHPMTQMTEVKEGYRFHLEKFAFINLTFVEEKAGGRSHSITYLAKSKEIKRLFSDSA